MLVEVPLTAKMVLEGFGEWQRNGTINPQTDMDTSLSDGYGVYGCNIIDAEVITETYYDIQDVYMSGLYHNYPRSRRKHISVL